MVPRLNVVITSWCMGVSSHNVGHLKPALYCMSTVSLKTVPIPWGVHLDVFPLLRLVWVGRALFLMGLHGVGVAGCA